MYFSSSIRLYAGTFYASLIPNEGSHRFECGDTALPVPLASYGPGDFTLLMGTTTSVLGRQKLFVLARDGNGAASFASFITPASLIYTFPVARANNG